MSTGRTEQSHIRLSLLDRLIDDEPQIRTEAPLSDAEKLRRVQRSVRRDLEHLLNTRYRCVAWPPALTEIDNSLVNYGIPDFTASSLNVVEESDFMLQAVKQAINFFEPRLTDVQVFLVKSEEEVDRTFRFRIEAMLLIEDSRHRVQFNSSMEATTGQFDIE